MPTITHSLRSVYKRGITLHRFGDSEACLAGIGIHMLLYADDIVRISESPEELQRHLNALKVFCMDKGLSINMDKTKANV